MHNYIEQMTDPSPRIIIEKSIFTSSPPLIKIKFFPGKPEREKPNINKGKRIHTPTLVFFL